MDRRIPRIFLIQGPNMNWLGKRQPELYGHTTSAELDTLCQQHASEQGYGLTIFYSNSQGTALDRLYEAVEADEIDGLVMNPAAWSMGSGASIRDCLRSIDKPYGTTHVVAIKRGETRNSKGLYCAWGRDVKRRMGEAPD